MIPARSSSADRAGLFVLVAGLAAALLVACARITAGIFDVLTVEASVASRKSFGGTAPSEVKKQIACAVTDIKCTCQQDDQGGCCSDK